MMMMMMDRWIFRWIGGSINLFYQSSEVLFAPILSTHITHVLPNFRWMMGVDTINCFLDDFDSKDMLLLNHRKD